MDPEFSKLLNDIIENPELLLDTSKISNEQVLEIQKHINPYIKLSGPIDPNNKQIAVCSYTNLREDYIKRFTMTSLVSFIFQMLHEYTVPKNKRVWTPKENDSGLFNISELKSRVQGILTIIEEAEETERNELKFKQQDLLKDSVELSKNIYNQQQKKIGLLFTLTTMLKDLGIDASSKLVATTEEANKFPEIKEIIKTKRHSNINFAEYEFPENNAKEIINSFLQEYFVFDPSIHIRSGLNVDSIRTEVRVINGESVVIDIDDPSHLTIYELKKRLPAVNKQDKDVLDIILSNDRYLNASRCIIRDENMHDAIKYAIDNVDTFKHYLLPVTKINSIISPQDTFHRWSYFTEVNYEELRTITETLYPEKSDLDWALAIWTTFKGTDTELDEQFKEYCQKNSEEMPSVMKSIEVGKWTLLADFKENRKNVQFYNKNTDVLKKIIERHTEDKKIGTELMRNRVKQVKAKNIAEAGPDAPGLKTYKTTMAQEGKDLTSRGVERVITAEEMKRLEKTQGNIKAAKELEVIEEYETLLKGLDDIKKYRDLTTEEQDKYTTAKSYLLKAKEMINVPDNAIQVDVFTNDTKSGNFTKTHFYTKCDEALEEEENKK